MYCFLVGSAAHLEDCSHWNRLQHRNSSVLPVLTSLQGLYHLEKLLVGNFSWTMPPLQMQKSTEVRASQNEWINMSCLWVFLLQNCLAPIPHIHNYPWVMLRTNSWSSSWNLDAKSSGSCTVCTLWLINSVNSTASEDAGQLSRLEL